MSVRLGGSDDRNNILTNYQRSVLLSDLWTGQFLPMNPIIMLMCITGLDRRLCISETLKHRGMAGFITKAKACSGTPWIIVAMGDPW